MTKEEIHYICKEYSIKNYTINSDMSINVDGGVRLSDKYLTNFPLKFGKVTKYFICTDTLLTTLEGCPNYVGGDFWCSRNKLTTLEYCPNWIGGRFLCSFNNLSTLQHLPINFHIGDFFDCHKNPIRYAQEYGRLFFGHIGGSIVTEYDTVGDFLNKNKNPPKKDLPRLLRELRKIQL